MTEDNVIPIDPEVRLVLEEFNSDPAALAAEIVGLRAALAGRPLPAAGIVIPTPPRPPSTRL